MSSQQTCTHMDKAGTAQGIYRMEAVETGDNTGVFEGTVSYVQMNTVDHVIDKDNQAADSVSDPARLCRIRRF